MIKVQIYREGSLDQKWTAELIKTIRRNVKYCSELCCIWQYSGSFGRDFGLKLALVVTKLPQKVRVKRDYTLDGNHRVIFTLDDRITQYIRSSVFFVFSVLW